MKESPLWISQLAVALSAYTYKLVERTTCTFFIGLK